MINDDIQWLYSSQQKKPIIWLIINRKQTTIADTLGRQQKLNVNTSHIFLIHVDTF